MIKNKDFSNVIDPWDDYKDIAGVQESKFATLNSYRKASLFCRFPRIEVKTKKDIVIMGTGLYKRLNPDLRRRAHVVISPKDVIRDFSILFKLMKSFTFDLAIYSRVYNQIINKNNSENFLEVRRALGVIKPRVIILKSTMDPINRIWAFWASELNIKVICIQHGIFSSRSNVEIMERDIVDHYIALGEKQSKIISEIIPKYKHINVYGYDNFSCNLRNKETISVCFIGSDYERYSDIGKERKKKMLDIYINLIDILYQEEGVKYKFFYKMHPSEAKSNRISGLVEIIQEAAYDKIDIFVGIESTLLMQLASLQKCAIQLRSESLQLDDYQKMGYCGSIKIKDIKDKGFITALDEGNPFPYLKEKDISEIIRSII